MTREEYRNAFAGYRRLVEQELSRLFAVEAQDVYPRLREAMYYSLEAGGKRLRPCLVLAVCDMLGGSVQSALPFACGLEMIHTYSLIHDDMPGMDDDDLRRGRPSNHKVFGEGIALLAGDALLSFAFGIMLDAAVGSGEAGAFNALRTITAKSGAAGMLTGQAADKENENSAAQSEKILRYIHKHKTSDMIEAAVLSGAYLANASDESVGKLKTYSERIGLLFQITDDLLDASGDQSLVGKTLGKDEAEGKLTFVSLLGTEGARKAAERLAEEAKEAAADISGAEILCALADDLVGRKK